MKKQRIWRPECHNCDVNGGAGGEEAEIHGLGAELRV